MRIFVDTQSNPLFQRSPLEQAYSLRGGLCEAGKDDVVVIPYKFDPEYLQYWRELGFDLPTILVAKNDQPNLTLSQLIMQDKPLSEKLRAIATDNSQARLEFFCIEETERQLEQHLGIPAYCNFKFAFEFAKKPRFRKFCLQYGIPATEGCCCSSFVEAEDFILGLHAKGVSALVKSESGTGGITCGGAIKIDPSDNIASKLNQVKFIGQEFVVEKVIDNVHEEISVHWEITVDGAIHIVGIQDQLAKNFGYSGVSFPTSISTGKLIYLEKTLLEVLAPKIRDMGAIGFFSCDVILSPEEHWMDFNPRKGAAIYVRRMVDRICKKYFGGKVFAWHEHIKLPKETSFVDVRRILGEFLIPGHEKNQLVVITNSGVIPFGYLDITSISTESRKDAKLLFNHAKNLVLGH